MRNPSASALCCVLSFICVPGPAVAQSTPSSSHPPQPVLHNSPAAVLELPKTIQTAPLRQQNAPAKDTESPIEEVRTWLSILQHQKDGPGLRRFGRAFDSSQCAHIRIFQAPETDSEMIVEAPPGAGGNITIFEGLRPCCRDIAEAPSYFPGLKLFPRRVPPAKLPLVQPYVIQPNKNGDLAPNPK